MEDYIATPVGLHANFHIFTAVQSKDSLRAAGHGLFLYLFRNNLCSEVYRAACWQFL